MSDLNGLVMFTVDQLKQHRLRLQEAGDSQMVSRINRALQLKGHIGEPVPGMPGLLRRLEQPSATNGGRFITRFEDDGSGRGMLAWLAPFMTDGPRCRIDPDMALQARRTAAARGENL